MSLRRSSAILRHEMRVMFTDPSTAIFVIIMPLLMVALMKQLFANTLAQEGLTGTNGSEFAVPGMAVSFAAFSVGYAGFSFFRDHGWGTWDRLRASPATSVDLIVGKVLPTVAVTVVQLGVLFALGGPLFGLTITGSVVGLVLLIVVLALALSAFGMLVTALARTMNQLNAIGSVGGMAMAMMGGSFVPVSAMPGWAQTLAPALPTYWAMRGFRTLILENGTVADVLVPVLMLVGFGALFTAVAAARFRFEDTKVYWG
ncbi:MAG: ABC transporter permease [Sporichthyaceae bacterium]|nr:ABC transporter permease [Sporichthyaceae bacterium]